MAEQIGTGAKGRMGILAVGQRVWYKRSPMVYRGRVTAVKGEKRKRYMVRWDGYEHDSGEYGISEFLIEAQVRP